MSDSDSEDLKLNPMDKMRIRVAAEGYKTLDEKNNNRKGESAEPLNDKNTPFNDKEDMKTYSHFERGMALLLVIMFIVLIALTVLLATNALTKSLEQKCMTPSCIEITASLIKNMDMTIKPCDNFYQYACGRFESNPLIPPDEKKFSQFSYTKRATKAQVRLLLEQVGSSYRGVDHSTAIEKLKLYYRMCMNTTAMEDMGVLPLLDWLKSLGAWKIDYNLKTGNWSIEDFQIENSMGKLIEHNIPTLFSFGVAMDLKNNSVNILYFDQGGLSFVDHTNYIGNKSEVYEEIYNNYYMSVMNALGRNPLQSKSVASSLWKFESMLAEITDNASSRVDINKQYKKITLEEIQKIIDPAVFNIYLLLEHVYNRNFSSSEKAIMNSHNFFSQFSSILGNTTSTILVNYFLWRAIQAVLPYQPRNLQKAFWDTEAVLFGIKTEPPLWSSCVTATESVFPDVVGALYVDDYFNHEIRFKSEELVKQIVSQFQARLPKVNWMDEDTLIHAQEKVNAVSYKIGYPDDITDPKKLDSTYDKLNVTDKTAFINYVNVLKFTANKSLSRLDRAPDKSRWSMAVTDANAYYSATHNEMVFPAGILSKPFYDLDFPMAMNYGSMGFIMGHELIHGFDNKGRNFDFKGNLQNWWSNSSMQHFKENQQCLVHQYEKYKVGDSHVNGLTTLAENIADNGGLKISYNAYQSWKKENGFHEFIALLPGLNTTENQLFFLAFAQTWCSYYTPEYAQISLLTDAHTYAKYRVIGTLSNSKEFSKAYNCPVDSPMNAVDKCVVW